MGQERLWLLSRTEPVGAALNRSYAIRLIGSLDETALKQGLARLIGLHEVLRTRFVEVDERPHGLILSHRPAAVPTIDLSTQPESRREARLTEIVEESAGRPFDLSLAPALRLCLVRMSDEEHVLLLTVHPIAFDDASLPVFARHLAATYQHFSAGRKGALRSPALQFAGWADRQTELQRGEEGDSLRQDWQAFVEHAPPLMELAADRPRPAIYTRRTAAVTFPIPTAMARALARLGQPEGGSPATSALTAFVALLSRLNGAGAVSLAVTPSGQRPPECEEMVGPFAHPVTVLTDVPGDPPFSRLVRAVRSASLEALDRPPPPLDWLRASLPEPDANQLLRPLIGFECWPALSPVCGLPDLEMIPMRLGPCARPEDLTLIVEEQPDGLIGRLVYSVERFDALTVQRMAAQLVTLLEGVAADPDQPLSALPLMTAAERHQLLAEWNDTASAYSADLCLHELVEAQVERTPDAPAITFAGEQLTYEQLNRRANQLAHALIRVGVGPNVPVGIYVDRSMDVIVSVLAVLKAGGTQVPIDPNYAAARIGFILADTRTAVLLTQQRLLAQLPEYSGRTVCLDTDGPEIARESPTNLPRRITPDDPACILYTSGSQGQPKGALLSHRSLVNYTEAAAAHFEIGPEDRVLQFASISFDASAEEIYPCLSRGATLVLRAEWMMASTSVFLKMCHDQAVTVLDLPTAYWHTLVQSSGSGPLSLPPSLRLVIIGGEKALPARLAAWHRKTAGRVRLVNTYGPTEATIVTAWCDLAEAGTAERGFRELPIGRPVPNTRIYLLDRFQQPVPVGVPGELHIGGVGLARGYLNRPELTAQRFIDDPFSTSPDSRLYRTGDLARYRPDGVLEFVGRQDGQVKVRGFRIELGEIEAALTQHAGVHECVVVAKENAPGEKHLVAYYVPAGGSSTAPGDLRQFLRGRLPDYMHPSTFQKLDTLPLTPSGKVDRRFLMAVEDVRSRPETDLVRPRTALEQEIAEIWEEELGVRPIGAQDNFFDLGGHSLLAVGIFARIEARWNRELPLALLFDAPTVEEMAAVLERGNQSGNNASLVAIQPRGARPPLFCVHGIGGNVLNYYRLVSHLGEDQPLYGLQAQGLTGQLNDLVTVESMAAHYIQEIRQVQPRGPYAIGGYSFGGVVAFEMARQLQAEGEEVALLVVFDNWAPVDPPRWEPLYRLAGHVRRLAQLGPKRGLAYLQDRTMTLLSREIGGALRRAEKTLCPERRTSLSARLQDVEQNLIRALYQYEPGSYPGRVTLFRAQTRSIEGWADAAMGWRMLASGGVEVIEVPGDHNSILDDANVPVLAQRLRESLESAWGAKAETQPVGRGWERGRPDTAGECGGLPRCPSQTCRSAAFRPRTEDPVPKDSGLKAALRPSPLRFFGVRQPYRDARAPRESLSEAVKRILYGQHRHRTLR